MRYTLLASLFLLVLLALPAIAEKSNDAESVSLTAAEYFAAVGPGGGDHGELTRQYILDQVHWVQLGVERWSVDNSEYDPPTVDIRVYPYSLDQLVHPWSKYMSYLEPGLYPNPYTASDEDDYGAQPVPPVWSPASPGNFSYLTKYNTETGAVEDYLLIAYGPDQETDLALLVNGEALPGVILYTSPSTLDLLNGAEMYCGGQKYHIQAGSSS
jgi:hypothetical protein